MGTKKGTWGELSKSIQIVFFVCILLTTCYLSHFYNNRAWVELFNTQLKGDTALGHIPTRHVMVNETWFPSALAGLQSRQLVYAPYPATELQTGMLHTLRHRILLVPAQLC